ncbi:MAG: hypothetical protein AB7U62_14945 [Pseudolabrys sp.]
MSVRTNNLPAAALLAEFLGHRDAGGGEMELVRTTAAAVREYMLAGSPFLGPDFGGVVEIPLTFSTTTTDSDPGAGTLRLNHATQTSATQIYVDLADSAAADITAALDGLIIGSRIVLAKAADRQSFIVATLTARASPAGYRKLTITQIGSGGSAFADGDALVLIYADAALVLAAAFGIVPGTVLRCDEDGWFGGPLTEEDIPEFTELSVDGFPVATEVYARAAAVRRGHLAGLTLSAAGGTATFGIAAGEAADSTAARIMKLAAAITKTTAAWAAGSGNGALDTGTIANNTWYHAFEIERSDTGLIDAVVSLSPTAPTMPANYDYKRRIGSMKTDGSAQWIKFIQFGDEFLWDVPVADIGAADHNMASTLRPLTVPSGIKVQANIAISQYNANICYSMFTSPDQVDTAPNGNSMFSLVSNPSVYGSGRFWIFTNTSRQIRTRSNEDGSLIYGITHGWIDRRGQDD